MHDVRKTIAEKAYGLMTDSLKFMQQMTLPPSEGDSNVCNC